MKFHDAANLFPMLVGADFVALVQDIRANGQRETIKTLHGEILDGRNRWRACSELSLTPRVEKLPLDTDPIRYVVSLNIHRRHLADRQRAWIAAKIANTTNGSNQHEKKVGGPIGPPTQPPISIPEAAEMLNVSDRSVKRAKRVQDHGIPEVQKAVEEGHMSLHHAAEVVVLPGEEQRDKVRQATNNNPEQKNRKSRRRSTRPDRRKGTHQATTDELTGARSQVDNLLRQWESMGGLKKLVGQWEKDERWAFCDKLEELSKVLRRLSLDLRHLNHKKPTGRSPAPEVEQKPSEPAIHCPEDEQRDTERLRVEKTETALGATGAGARELEAAALISESEPSGRLPDEAGKVTAAERETEPDTAREREGQRHGGESMGDKRKFQQRRTPKKKAKVGSDFFFDFEHP